VENAFSLFILYAEEIPQAVLHVRKVEKKIEIRFTLACRMVVVFLHQKLFLFVASVILTTSFPIS
jgi:hypothetical protein